MLYDIINVKIRKGEKTMKKQTMAIIIIAIVVAIIAVAIAFVTCTNKENITSNVKLESTQDITKMFSSIYADLGDSLPNLETADIDISDDMMVEEYTGLKSAGNVELLVVSEPLMSSQAYSAVAIKVKDGADIETMKQEILDNINMRKWICVSAGKIYITNHDNVIFFVMADEDWAKPVYENFKKFVNNEVGKELEKTGEEDGDIALPPEMMVTVQ